MAAPAPTEPITLEIIQSSLQATSDEMFAAFRKTAMSAIIYEVLDMGTAITDAEGNLASSGAGIPAFVGVLDKAVMRIIELNGEPGRDRPGRHLRHQRPVLRRRHAPERRRARDAGLPRRAADRLDGEHRALERRRRHGAGLDLDRRDRALPGGAAASRASSSSPAGQPIESVMRIIEVNSRLPDYLRGDMWAGHRGRARRRAAAARARRRATALDTFLAALDHFMDYGERGREADARRSCRRARSRSRRSRTAAQVYTVTVEITDEEFVVDLRDNPDQDRGPNNASRDGSLVAAQMVFMNLTESHSLGQRRPLPAG